MKHSEILDFLEQEEKNLRMEKDHLLEKTNKSLKQLEEAKKKSKHRIIRRSVCLTIGCLSLIGTNPWLLNRIFCLPFITIYLLASSICIIPSIKTWYIKTQEHEGTSILSQKELEKINARQNSLTSLKEIIDQKERKKSPIQIMKNISFFLSDEDYLTRLAFDDNKKMLSLLRIAKNYLYPKEEVQHELFKLNQTLNNRETKDKTYKQIATSLQTINNEIQRKKLVKEKR